MPMAYAQPTMMTIVAITIKSQPMDRGMACPRGGSGNTPETTAIPNARCITGKPAQTAERPAIREWNNASRRRCSASLFRLHVERQGQIDVDETTMPLYRELAAHGLMMAGSTFRDGAESIYRLTQEGFDRKTELLAKAMAIGSSPSESAALRR